MRFFILCIVMLSLFSCSAKRLPPTELIENSYRNRLVKKGCSISVPDDFIFFLKKNEIKNVVARFKGPKVSGIVEILFYSLPMVNEKLAGYYADRVLEKAMERTISKVSSKKDIYIISAESDDGKRAMRTALWLIEKKKLFIIQLVAERGYFKENPELIPKLISGWKEENKDLIMRVKKGLPVFRSEENSFIWYNDLKNGKGFRIYDRIRKIRIRLSESVSKNMTGTVVDLKSYGKMNFEVRQMEAKKAKYRIFLIRKDGFEIQFRMRKDHRIDNLSSYLNSFFSEFVSTLTFKGENPGN